MLILSGTAVGFMASHRLSMRVEFLSHYLKFISFCETQIRFSAMPILEILKKQIDVPFISPFIKGCVRKIESGMTVSSAWEKSLREINKDMGLTDEDITVIKDFGLGLGQSDVQGQISHCQLNIKLINEILNSANENKFKKSRIYTMLGSFSGLAIVLIMC